MTTSAKLRFSVTDPAAEVAAGYDQIKIERDISGGGYSEISRDTTRLPLSKYVEQYVYSDPAWDELAGTYNYRAVLYNSVTQADHGTPIAITSVEADRYTTLAAIRREGVLATDVDDDEVRRTIELADRYIEEQTGQWFTPRYCQFMLDGDNRADLPLEVAIIAIQEMKIDTSKVDLTGTVINNRHLTTGMKSPDDRSNPRIVFEHLYSATNPLQSLFSSSYGEGRHSVSVKGIFGFTDLSRGSIPGETEAGSQVPLDYGVTPQLIEWCSRAIVITKIYPMISDKALQIQLADRIIKQKTKQQEVAFSPVGEQTESTSGQSSTFAMRKSVDQILERYRKPVSLGFV